MKPTLEIAVFNLESALMAAAAGADRIELCENPFDGGTTPSYGFLRSVAEQVSIPVFPIIRARGGDFLYTDAEFKAMCYDIQLCRELGFKGVVSGILMQDGRIDVKRTAQMVELAEGMEFTYHRAFDRAYHPLEALEDIIQTGARRILTSGQVPNAWDGRELIRNLVEQAGERIIIMPGSGVRSTNIATLRSYTNAKEFHSSARISEPSKMLFHPESMQEHLDSTIANQLEIKSMQDILAN